MSNVNVFSPKFVTAARAFLKTNCANYQRVNREQVSEHLATLGIQASPELVGLAVDAGAIDTDTQMWRLYRGRYGGIREVDVESFKAEQTKLAAAQARAEKARAARAAKSAPQISANA